MKSGLSVSVVLLGKVMLFERPSPPVFPSLNHRTLRRIGAFDPLLPVMTGGFGASGPRLLQPIVWGHGITVQPWQSSSQCKAGGKHTG